MGNKPYYSTHKSFLVITFDLDTIQQLTIGKLKNNKTNISEEIIVMLFFVNDGDYIIYYKVNPTTRAQKTRGKYD